MTYMKRIPKKIYESPDCMLYRLWPQNFLCTSSMLILMNGLEDYDIVDSFNW